VYCCNKILKIAQLINNINLLLTVLEAGNSKIKFPVDLSVENLLLIEVPPMCPHMEEGK
jgi:hypothetical protein